MLGPDTMQCVKKLRLLQRQVSRCLATTLLLSIFLDAVNHVICQCKAVLRF